KSSNCFHGLYGWLLPTPPFPSQPWRRDFFRRAMTFSRNDFFARTMHTPDPPERAALRATLREISKTLIPLHRRLIDATKEDYAFAVGPVGTPARLLDLVRTDPFFAWLQPVTSLIVDIDEMARIDFEPAAAAGIAVRVEQLLDSERYLALLQRDVEVAIAHASLRKALIALAPRS